MIFSQDDLQGVLACTPAFWGIFQRLQMCEVVLTLVARYAFTPGDYQSLQIIQLQPTPSFQEHRTGDHSIGAYRGYPNYCFCQEILHGQRVNSFITAGRM